MRPGSLLAAFALDRLDRVASRDPAHQHRARSTRRPFGCGLDPRSESEPRWSWVARRDSPPSASHAATPPRDRARIPLGTASNTPHGAGNVLEPRDRRRKITAEPQLEILTAPHIDRLGHDRPRMDFRTRHRYRFRTGLRLNHPGVSRTSLRPDNPQRGALRPPAGRHDLQQTAARHRGLIRAIVVSAITPEHRLPQRFLDELAPLARRFTTSDIRQHVRPPSPASIHARPLRPSTSPPTTDVAPWPLRTPARYRMQPAASRTASTLSVKSAPFYIRLKRAHRATRPVPSVALRSSLRAGEEGSVGSPVPHLVFA